jgi:exodeoxyribonuclease III
LKIASWNVAGLRAVMRNHPDALADLVKKHDLDVLCLQETKLQESHLDDPKLKIRGHLLEEQGYDAYYTCSTAKKGYAGTAVFVRRRSGQTKGGGAAAASKQKQKTVTSFFKPKSETPATTATSTPTTATTTSAQAEGASLSAAEVNLVPQEVSYEMGKEKHDAEGRLVIVDFPTFSFANLYVPNSGQNLERLSYRTDEWDKDLLTFMQTRQKERGVPVMWLGDLNVAHTNLEVWNDGAKHLAKQAGVTPEERGSFQAMLDAGFVDAFRKLHPTAKGHYSYWSQRAGNREPNKGLRLDYFICDPSFFDESSKVVARDSYVLFDQIGSDHCPVVLELEIKP